ncbi:MAG: ATP-grasp domain-containing protein [Bacteroidales bacterium]|nr:ATP-grasp domain-containing protein [Bacteroidales bacterium]
MKKNILVFPCGSEIALEVYRSVKDSAHFNLIGASSVDDHGKFVYEKYIGGVPFITDPDFLITMKRVVIENQISAIYPAMDSVIEILKAHEDYLGCIVVTSCFETTSICLSKNKTYEKLQGVVKIPHIYKSVEDIQCYPVFVKPDIGYGSRGAKKINNKEELKLYLRSNLNTLICDYILGKEYTVDCFTDFNGKLIVVKPRERCRVMNGISVNTKPVIDNGEFMEFAQKINANIKFNGAWFFQVKRDSNESLTLLEIASRFGGSSSLFRAKGINFALMSLYNALGIPVSVIENDYEVEMDRALDNKYKINLSYNEVFVDFDDCIYLDGKNVNPSLIAFLYRCINNGIKITLLSKHDDEKLEGLDGLLKKLRIQNLFDRIIHLNPADNKYKYIDNKKSIFIDDSFSERLEIVQNCDIPVFGIDMVEVL